MNVHTARRMKAGSPPIPTTYSLQVSGGTYVDFGNVADLGTGAPGYTIMARVYIQDDNQTANFMEKRTVGNRSGPRHFYPLTERLSFHQWDASSRIGGIFAGSIQDRWGTTGIAYNGNLRSQDGFGTPINFRCSLDGVADAWTSTSAGTILAFSESNPLWLGENMVAGDYIHEFALFYGSYLTQAEMTTLTGPGYGVDWGAALLWVRPGNVPTDSAANGGQITDLSGNGNHGTVVGAGASFVAQSPAP